MSSIEQKSFVIIIVGGGIAGLAAAIALRGPGRKITILEQSSLNREIGATISLQPNATKIVEKGWGMADALKNVGAMRDEGFDVYSTDGNLQRRIPLASKTEYGADRMIYHRKDLHDALKHFATRSDGHGDGAEILTSSSAIACDLESGTVVAADGNTFQGDLIIAADGIKSKLRKYFKGHEVKASPTGLCAYRLMVETSKLEKDKSFCNVINPRAPFTSMIMGHEKRIIMGPARSGAVYSVVALVPDLRAAEDTNNSWTSEGDLAILLEEYKDFPDWCKAPFRLADDIGLWQLRDMEPLGTWCKGRGVLIGDAAHAMLPTQGQGASQAIEDAEALGEFFSDIRARPSFEEVQSRLDEVFDARYERATTIQRYSREAAQPATAKGETKITMNPAQFMDYNCLYDGAKRWVNSRASVQAEVAVLV